MRVLKPGLKYNPFKKWPPNLFCFCGSGANFKRCCIDKIPAGVPETNYESLRRDCETMIAYVEGRKANGQGYKLKKPLL
jgi:SEC-C motif